MTNSIIFSIFSFIYILLMMFVYFSRKRIKTIENKIYSYLIIINLIGLALEIVDAWINTEFEGDRHSKRVNMIKEIEERYNK